MMSRAGRALRTMGPMKRWLDWRRWTVYVHRWLGIAGGVLFVAWFVSGVVMMYARMPGLANEERLARAPALDLAGVTLTPLEAARAAGLAPDGRAPAELTRTADGSTAPNPAGIRVDRVRIGMHGNRTVYRFGAFRSEKIVFADTGEVLTHVGRAEAEALVRPYAPGYDGPFHYDGYLTEPDQWTLQARGQMPMHRFALDDADDTRLYVSSLTGEVVLRTTSSERFWGYLGPVTHWIYFTPLRKRGSGCDLALPGSGSRWHRAEDRRDPAAAALAVPGAAQPRLPVPLLRAPALGCRRHRSEHRRHRGQCHHARPGVAPTAAPRGKPRVETPPRQRFPSDPAMSSEPAGVPVPPSPEEPLAQRVLRQARNRASSTRTGCCRGRTSASGT